MAEILTAVCAGCLTRVDAAELENSQRKCEVCRGITQGVVVVQKGNQIGNTEAVNVVIEELHAGGHALLDLREFDGGTGPDCDEA